MNKGARYLPCRDPSPTGNRRARIDLLRDGARIVTSVDDVLEELGPVGRTRGPARTVAASTRRPNCSSTKSNNRSSTTSTTVGSDVDDVAEQCQTPIGRVLATISVLGSPTSWSAKFPGTKWFDSDPHES